MFNTLIQSVNGLLGPRVKRQQSAPRQNNAQPILLNFSHAKESLQVNGGILKF